MAKLTLAILALCIAYAACDLYLHNPRGSNDRLNEANTNRNNANRLFDSQNNAKGGYCIGPAMTFYEGSLLTIEWAVQHGCGSNPKMFCNMVIQYMCGHTSDNPLILIRDGTTTNTITDTAAGAEDVADATTTPITYTYGMHESYQFYTDCATRNRNMGLYIADRAAQGNLVPGRTSSIYTRQDNNGDRHGFECAEERDYYPYWHPSPWKDIAILTSDTSFCDFYKSQSQNVLAKGFCQDPQNIGSQAAPNNPADCSQAGFTWNTTAAFGISAPECLQVPWSRENHLGNGPTGSLNSYNATIPSNEACASTGDCVCVLRIRYNISTIEKGYPSMSNPSNGFIDWTNNAAASPIKQDPTISVLNSSNYELTLAVDTSQFGRTFQDRSHTFGIKQRPSGVSSTARMFNLNVRGKRGNIVQAYPATEYDFVPQYLYTRVGDYVHFQWTGCDTNPAGNAGEGTDGSDRSNIVQMEKITSSEPATDAWISSNPKLVFIEQKETRIRFAMVDQDPSVCVLGVTNQNDPTNCGKLNAASEYFDGGLMKMNKTGTFAYMSTRNHNFSNRDQKGIIYVIPLLPTWAIAVVSVGAILFGAAAGAAGLMFYAKSHPHSGVANMFSKM